MRLDKNYENESSGNKQEDYVTDFAKPLATTVITKFGQLMRQSVQPTSTTSWIEEQTANTNPAERVIPRSVLVCGEPLLIYGSLGRAVRNSDCYDGLQYDPRRLPVAVRNKLVLRRARAIRDGLTCKVDAHLSHFDESSPNSRLADYFPQIHRKCEYNDSGYAAYT